MRKRLVYRVLPLDGGVVFASPARATLIAKIHTAIESSNTWGDFRSAMPRRDYSTIIRSFDDEGLPRPKSTDAFSVEAVPGYTDGDYPAWLQREMGKVLPKAILERFGTLKSTYFSGEFWFIAETDLPAVCAALKALGWEVESAQDLEFR